jgi:hypothetical protein
VTGAPTVTAMSVTQAVQSGSFSMLRRFAAHAGFSINMVLHDDLLGTPAMPVATPPLPISNASAAAAAAADNAVSNESLATAITASGSVDDNSSSSTTSSGSNGSSNNGSDSDVMVTSLPSEADATSLSVASTGRQGTVQPSYVRFPVTRLPRGPQPTFQPHGGDLAACVAAAKGDAGVATLAMLVHELGADPFLCRPRDGCTSLHVAARTGSADLVELILSTGTSLARLQAVDCWGYTAAEAAAAAGHRSLSIKLWNAVCDAVRVLWVVRAVLLRLRLAVLASESEPRPFCVCVCGACCVELLSGCLLVHSLGAALIPHCSATKAC